MIGTFDANHVFPEDIIMEENDLLVAMHFTVAAPTGADWIDCLLPSSRREDKTTLDTPALVRSRDTGARL